MGSVWRLPFAAASICCLLSKAARRLFFSALIAISLYARKRRLFLLLCGASAFAACVALPCFAVWVDGGRAEAISIAFFLSGAGSTVRLGWESSMFGRGPFQAAILAAASYGMGFLIFVGICAVPRGSVAIGSFLPALSLALFVAFRLRNLACRNLPDSSGAARFASLARPAHPSSPLGMPSRRASRLFGALGLVFFAYGIMRSSGVAEGIPTSGGAFAAALPALGSCCAVLCASFAFRRRPFAIVYASFTHSCLRGRSAFRCLAAGKCRSVLLRPCCCRFGEIHRMAFVRLRFRGASAAYAFTARTRSLLPVVGKLRRTVGFPCRSFERPGCPRIGCCGSCVPYRCHGPGGSPFFSAARKRGWKGAR